MATHLKRTRTVTAFKAAIAMVVAGTACPGWSSSHREAPAIAMNPTLDATDLYLFRSYESGRSGFVTVLANYIPFQDPQGGPNFFMFNPDGLYEIHIDNNGDGAEDLTFQFQFRNESKKAALPVGGKRVRIPLINSGPVSGVNPDTLNVREVYTLDLVRGERRAGPRASVTNASGGAAVFDKPVDNIGDKVFGGSTGYQTYANQHLYSIAIPGCNTPGKVFVGQRKEPFYIAVGKIFDLFNLNPLGPEIGGNNNDLEGKNISTLALELPINCLTAGGADPVIGAWTTASQRQTRVLNPSPGMGLGRAAASSGEWVQVSRLANPLVNEVVIGLDDKDRFNASRPTDDPVKFADYVTNPVLPTLIESLFPVAAPKNFPRTDLLTAFLKGFKGLNQPATVVPAELMRLNTAVAPTVMNAQNPLGVAGGDNAGYPNGRRPGDDVVDLSLRVAMGALCVLTGPADTLQVGCKPADAPSGGLPFTDGVRKTASNYGPAFPYLTTPLPGNFNPPPAPGTTYP